MIGFDKNFSRIKIDLLMHCSAAEYDSLTREQLTSVTDAVTSHFVLSAFAVPNSVATMAHVDTGMIQAPKLFRPTASNSE